MKNNKWPTIQDPILTKLSDVLTFGKYRGKTLEEVSETNANYILWLIENTATVSLSYTEENLIDTLSREQFDPNFENWNYSLDYDMGDRD
jgi:hypothetical protein